MLSKNINDKYLATGDGYLLELCDNVDFEIINFNHDKDKSHDNIKFLDTTVHYTKHPGALVYRAILEYENMHISVIYQLSDIGMHIQLSIEQTRHICK